MIVAHLNTNDNKGGAARAVNRLHKGLLNKGVDSRMVVLHRSVNDNKVQQVAAVEKGRDRTQETLLKLIVQEEYINKRRSELSNTFFSLGYPGFDVSTSDLIRHSDVLNLHWIIGLLTPVTLRRLFALRKPTVWTLHDQWPFTGGCHFSAGCDGFTKKCNECPMLLGDELSLPAALLNDKKESFRGSNVTLVSPTRWLASLAEKSVVFDRFKVEVIPNSVDTSFFRPLPKPEAKSRLGIHPDTICLLCVAENPKEKRKGFDLLRQCISSCASDERFGRLIQSNRIMLLVAGGIPDDLDQLGVPATALGYLESDEKLRDAYCASDIFLLPSTEDNLPNTLLEAMSCGIPTVAFSIGGIPEVVKSGTSGSLIEVGDWQAMARGILELVFDSSRLESLSENARQTIMQGYALSVQAERYASLYEKMLSAGEGLRKRRVPQEAAKSAESGEVDAMSATEDVLVPLNTEIGVELGRIIQRAAAVAPLSRGDEGTSRQWRAKPMVDEIPRVATKVSDAKDQDKGVTHLRPDRFADYTYSKKSHFSSFRKPGVHSSIDPERANLKVYQDLLIYNFLLDNLEPGARILEIGGGNSRIIQLLKNTFEFWNLDKLEGIGNGPRGIGDQTGFRLIQEYIGDFSPSLPENYFDCVFSISVLEHLPQDRDSFGRVCADIDRLLQPGGFSVHCLDVVWKDNGIWSNQFLNYLYSSVPVLNPLIPWSEVIADPDLYVMSREAYDNCWMSTTRRSYEEFGKPFSYNVIWRKSEMPSNEDSKKTIKSRAPLGSSRKRLDAPRISIVTPSFNQGVYLEECIDSVLSQNYPNLEYIIMDGGSTDDSSEIIKKYERHLTSWQSKPDGGQYQALHDAFEKTTGDVMGWLNSDDRLHPDALWKVAYVFSSFPDVQWITGRPTAWDAEGRVLWVKKDLPNWTPKLLLEQQREALFPQQESTFWRRSLWLKAGGRLDTNLKLAADFELWVRFFQFAELFTVDSLLGGYREHGNQKGRTQRKEYLEETEKVLKTARHKLEKQSAPSKTAAGSRIIAVPPDYRTIVSSAPRGAIETIASDRLTSSLVELVGRQFEQLQEKEQKLAELKTSLDQRLAAIEEKEEEIARTQNAARERAQALVEKEEEITATQKAASDRARSLLEKEEEIKGTQKAAMERAQALYEKEKEISATHKDAEERASALIEKEAEIAVTHEVADERARGLAEKEAMINSLYETAEERFRVIHLINQELETIKKHWIYRSAVRIKRLLEKLGVK